jgi:hypothetical protein
MHLPFSKEDFFRVFAEYNYSVFPGQFILFLLAVIAIVLIRMQVRIAGRFAFFVLGLLWLWMGVAYHWAFFTSINKAAWIFGALFVIEGILLFVHGIKNNPQFSLRQSSTGIIAFLMIVFAMLIYPVIGFIAGHHYPATPTFGLPCPTTIYTFAVFLLADKKIGWRMFIIPAAWALIGFTASFTMGVYQDIALPIAAIIFLNLNRRKNN